MNKEERQVITDLKKCNFKEYYEYFKMKSEERKAMSKEEKKVSYKTTIAIISGAHEIDVLPFWFTEN